VQQVPNDRVGLIIGKGGATIKDLQNRSGARIQIPPQPDANSNPPVRTVSITGVGDAPQRAKYEIEQMVQSFETHGYIGGGGTGGYQQQQPQQPSAYGPPGGHYGAPQHAPAPYGAAPYGQPAYGAPQPYGMPQQGYGMPQQPYDQRYQQPGLTDPYAQQYGMQQQVPPIMHQQHYGQQQPQQPIQQQQQQPVTAASAANSGGAAAASTGSAAAAAPAAAGNVDLTQYHSVSLSSYSLPRLHIYTYNHATLLSCFRKSLDTIRSCDALLRLPTNMRLTTVLLTISSITTLVPCSVN
jgi:KH domain